MNKEKLKSIELYCGIDTLQVRSETVLEDKVIQFVTGTNSRNGKVFHYRLNPDKANDYLSIYNGADYYKMLDYMLDTLELKEPKKERIDIRFDSFDENYNELLKLNRLLILLIANKYNLLNTYESTDVMLLDHLCVRAQNKDGSIQIENYDKSKQEPNDIVKNRLEIRRSKIPDYIPENKKEIYVFKEWCDRFDNSLTVDNFNSLIVKINKSLLDRYNNEKDEKGFNWYEFIRAYRHAIFTSKQMSELARIAFNSKDPAQWAKRYKERRNIEYFSLQDVRCYVAMIKRNGKRFFRIDNECKKVQGCTDLQKNDLQLTVG